MRKTVVGPHALTPLVTLNCVGLGMLAIDTDSGGLFQIFYWIQTKNIF